MAPLDAALSPDSWLANGAVFVVGACIGSFLNVVIARMPAGLSVVRPRSHCACGQPIAWRDNVPLLSWFLLLGRARCCGRPIPARYPLVEWLTAGIFLACWLVLPPAVAACGWVFLSALVAASFIDGEHLMIPDVLTIGLGVAGVVLSLLVPALHGQQGGAFLLDSLRSGGGAVLGLVVGSGLVFWIAMLADFALGKDAMGFGDVKFVGAIGAFCGWQGAVFSVFAGAFLGTAWLGLAFAWRSLFRRGAGPVGFGSRIPFGPMLAAAGALHFLFLGDAVGAWFEKVSVLF